MKHLKEQLNKELVSLDEKVKKDGDIAKSDLDIIYKICKTLSIMKDMHMSYSDDISIEEELGGAEKYLKCYEKTGKQIYKDIAQDEIRHAKMLMEHMPEIKNKQILMDWHADLENRIKNDSIYKTSRL